MSKTILPPFANRRGPLYKHDCEDCVYLYTINSKTYAPYNYEVIDVYVCPNQSFGGSIVWRYGDKPEENITPGPIDTWSHRGSAANSRGEHSLLAALYALEGMRTALIWQQCRGDIEQLENDP